MYIDFVPLMFFGNDGYELMVLGIQKYNIHYSEIYFFDP